MNAEELENIVEELIKGKFESQTLEVKSAKSGAPKVYDTLSSFSNQKKGGLIIFGIDESDDFKPCGVYDLKDLQDRIAEQCEEMQPAIRGDFIPFNYKGLPLLALKIEGLPYTHRPCYRRDEGMNKGSYVRNGQFDVLMSELEINLILGGGKANDDIRVVDDERIPMTLNQTKIQRFIFEARLGKPNASRFSDEEVKSLMGLENNGKPTLLEVLLFSDWPQAIFPQLMVTAVVVPGFQMGDTNEAGRRFLTSKDIQGTIPELIEASLSFVSQNAPSPVTFSDGRRIQSPAYSLLAVREAITNALVHRDYSLYSETIPVRIEMYADRLEIISPGSINGGFEIDDLGIARIPSRNPNLVQALTILQIIESRYSGIPTIFKEARENNLPKPLFFSENGFFKVVMHYDAPSKLKKNEIDLIAFCKTPRSREEIGIHLRKTAYYAMRTYVNPLIAKGYLRFVDGKKAGSRYAKVVATNKAFDFPA